MRRSGRTERPWKLGRPVNWTSSCGSVSPRRSPPGIERGTPITRTRHASGGLPCCGSCAWIIIVAAHAQDVRDPSDRFVPPGWQGNPWGPAVTRARAEGQLPAIVMTPAMTRWDRWGRAVLRDGDIVFRMGDARTLGGLFPFSRFLADASGSRYSHTGIVAIEDGAPVVYDCTKAGVRRQPFAVWILDNVGAFGVKRLKAEWRQAIPGVLAYCRKVFEEQVPFDYSFDLDDSALYCLEMTEKAFRSQGLALSEPVRLGDMENATRYPICIVLFLSLSPLVAGATPHPGASASTCPGTGDTGCGRRRCWRRSIRPRPIARIEDLPLPSGRIEHEWGSRDRRWHREGTPDDRQVGVAAGPHGLRLDSGSRGRRSLVPRPACVERLPWVVNRTRVLSGSIPEGREHAHDPRGDPQHPDRPGGRHLRLHLRLRQGGLVPDQRPRGVRQLPRHAGAVRRVDQVEPPGRRRLQRLPHPARLRGQVLDEVHQRRAPLLRLHHRATSRTTSRSSRATRRSRSIPAGTATRRSCRRSMRRTPAMPRSSRASAVTTPWGTPTEPPGRSDPDRTRGTPHDRALEPDRPGPGTCPPHQPGQVGAHHGRGLRAGRRRRGGAAGQHHGAQGGGEEPLLPRRRADRRDRGPGRLGQELPDAVRRLPPDRRPGPDAVRRQRGRAPDAR